MTVHIRLLQLGLDLKSWLQEDGWQILLEPDGSILATHPEVTNESSARMRLYRLGLLISRNVRIDFSSRSREDAGILRTRSSFGGIGKTGLQKGPGTLLPQTVTST